MKQQAFRYLILALLLAISGCEEVIEFRGDKLDPKIVLYSLFDPDSVITVSVARSRAIFETVNKSQQITNAEVRIYSDGSLLSTLTYAPPDPLPDYMHPVPYSKYISDGVKPLAGSVYRIEVEIPGLKPVYAEVELPEVVVAQRIDTVSRTEKDGSVYLQARVPFTDPPGRDNYYRLNVRRIEGYSMGKFDDPFSSPDSVMVYNDEYTWSAADDRIINPSNDEDLFGMSESNQYHIFSDELIAGKTYELNLRLYMVPKDTLHYEFLHYVADIQSISKELYLFLRSSAAHVETRNSPFAEPVIVYSNVVNGLGCVGARVSSKIILKYGSYPVEGVKYVEKKYYWY